MRSKPVSAQSEIRASATIFTPWHASTWSRFSTEATVTSAPARRSTSMMITASIGSEPWAIGTKTYNKETRKRKKKAKKNLSKLRIWRAEALLLQRRNQYLTRRRTHGCRDGEGEGLLSETTSWRYACEGREWTQWSEVA